MTKIARGQNHAIDYRPDIDGLRAIAVCAVMAYHVGVFRMTGGYVGVDVFFVISGYLITSVIFKEIEGSKFSIAGFYERRIRRIFPALFAMLFVYSIFASVFLLPSELIDYAKTLMATTVSGSNFYLWTQSGYFDHRNSNPLLHTWSLAVEEQFYILFPIHMVLVQKFFARRVLVSLAVLSAVSFGLSVFVVSKSPDAAFYLPYTRAWELLTGAMVAVGAFPTLRTSLLRNVVSLAGLMMILCSVFIYTPVTLFPGTSALLPCIGSALIIGAGISGTSLVCSVLAWRPIVSVGLISYSLYLWHWPVIVVYQMGIINLSSWFERNFGNRFHPDRFDHIVEVVVSFLLAYLSWKFVELPFRKGRLRKALSRNQLFAYAGAFAVFLIAFSCVAIGSGGLEARFSPDTLRAASFLEKVELRRDEKAQRLGICFLDATTGVMDFDFNFCMQEKPGIRNYLLLGDSHAAAIWPALQQDLPNTNVMQVNVTSCPPTRLNHVDGSLCKKVTDYIFGVYLPSHPVHALILESDWTAESLGALDETLAWAKQHKVRVIVLGCVPEYDAPLARLVAYSIAWHKPDLPSSHLIAKNGALEPRLRTLVEDKWHFEFISLYDAVCPRGACSEYVDERNHVPLMDDSNHLNRFGAQFVVMRLIEAGEFMNLP